MARDRHEGGVAIYDLIRDLLRDGSLRTAAEISEVTGYSLGYVQRWLREMPDVIICGPGRNARRTYRYRIER